jgi:hypothetical protein
MGSDLISAEPNTVSCFNNLPHSLFSSVGVLLNGKPITLHKTNYHFKVCIEKVLNYGADASETHLVSSFWFLDSATADRSLSTDKANKGYDSRLNYLKES